MFSVCIYDNYDEDNLIVNHLRNDVSFQTDMEGGFSSAMFTVPYEPNVAINYWLNKHVVLFDFYGDRVFEGFIDKPTISGEDMKMTARGYYLKAKNIVAGPMYFSGQLEGALVTVSIDTAGSSYVDGDILTVSTGGTDGTIRVDGVDDSGVVQQILINQYGYGYSTGTSSCSGGSGTGFVVSIDAVETGSTSYDIAKFCADLNPYWEDDYSRISQLDRVPIGPLTLTRKDKIDGALSESKKFGYLDTDNYSPAKRRELFYVMYDNRILELRRVPDITVDEPDWELSIHNILGQTPLKLDIKADDIANQIWVEYNDPYLEGNTYTLGTKDRNSIEKYGIREDVVGIGQATSDVADVVEELMIEHRTEPTYSSTLNIAGMAYTNHGVPTPVWKIRAGDLIRIMDFDIGIEGLSGDKLGAISVVNKTNYKHASRTMSITLGTGDRLDIMLKRLGF